MQSVVLLALSLAGGAIVSTAIPASAQQATPESAQPATPEPAQEAITTSTQQSAVPTVIPVSGEFRTSAGEPRSGAVALIILALTGVSMMKGDRGFLGRGKYFVAAGLAVPSLAIVYIYS